MSDLVLDSSVTMAWCFDDELSEYAEHVLTRMGQGTSALVPALWAFEVANVLVLAERRNRIAAGKASSFLDDLGAMNISVDPPQGYASFRQVIRVAHVHNLSGYDAAYLELALRSNLPVATLDEKLRRAVQAARAALYE